MVKVPLPASLPVNVNVELPLPDIVEELNVAVTPVGSAPVDKVTVPLNPLSDVIVTVVEVEPNLDILRLEGEALMLKSGTGGVVTVRV